tara:strand:+ start:2285 stop:3235 length:951 start_codon:yes stop_codon:yes gene_type:complete
MIQNKLKLLLKNQIQGKIFTNEPMKKRTTFGVGGQAELYIFPKDKHELKIIINESKKHNIPIFVTGSGSNLLVSDSGFSGIMISLSKTFKKMSISDKLEINTESGVMLSTLVRKAIKKNIGGLESLIGVPGTVGGALVMNAGAYGSEISNFFTSANVINLKGEEKIYKKSDLQFKYRFSSFNQNEIITNIKFQCKKGNPNDIKNLRFKSSIKRKEAQPLNFKSAGSIFKNPKNGPAAGFLIDNVGLKGLRIGGAEISQKHANFIVNHGNAIASDVLELIKIIKKEVYEKYKILLELEIKLVGFNELIIRELKNEKN